MVVVNGEDLDNLIFLFPPNKHGLLAHYSCSSSLMSAYPTKHGHIFNHSKLKPPKHYKPIHLRWTTFTHVDIYWSF